jgi:hypothetical protein
MVLVDDAREENLENPVGQIDNCHQTDQVGLNCDPTTKARAPSTPEKQFGK